MRQHVDYELDRGSDSSMDAGKDGRTQTTQHRQPPPNLAKPESKGLI